MIKYLTNKKYKEDEIALILKSISDFNSIFEPRIEYPHIQSQISALMLAANQSSKPIVAKLIKNYDGSKIESNKINLKKAIVMITRSAMI